MRVVDERPLFTAMQPCKHVLLLTLVDCISEMRLDSAGILSSESLSYLDLPLSGLVETFLVFLVRWIGV